MARYLLIDKLKERSVLFYEGIKKHVRAKGELPWSLQIFIATFSWLVLFLILFFIWNPDTRWIIIIIAMVFSFLSVELLNRAIKKSLTKDSDKIEDFEDVEEDIEKSINRNSIILNEHVNRGGVVLVKKEKNNASLTPIVALKVSSISTDTSSYLGNLSSITKQKLSLKFHLSIVDSSQYELFLLKGPIIKCRIKKVFGTIKKFNELFYNEVFDLILDLKRETKIDFDVLESEMLKETFPTFGLIIDLNDDNQLLRENIIIPKSTKDDTTEISNHDDVLEKNEKVISKGEEEIVRELEEVKQEDRELEDKKKKIKEMLLQELNFSFDSFLNTSKAYYKKSIENQLEQKYPIPTEKFLKTVSLFCHKEQIPFFYPSYSYLNKIDQFHKIELPSSSEVEIYISKLANEYTSILIPPEVKEQLSSFLVQKSKNGNTNSSSNNDDDSTEKLSSIPKAPSNTKMDFLAEGGS